MLLSLITHALLRRIMSDPDKAVLATSWFVGSLFSYGIVFSVFNTAFQATVASEFDFLTSTRWSAGS